MRRDPTEFRERFKAYKEGKKPYENGLPAYKNGTSNIIGLLDKDQLDTLHYIYDYYSNLGMGTLDIAGIAANMFKESSLRHNAKDSSGYHGYVLMSPDMLLAVKKAYGNLNPDTLLQFVYDQVTGNSKVKGYTNGTGYKYGQYKTGGDAAEAFRATFERNKAGRQQSRIDYGNQFYDYFTKRAIEKKIGKQPEPIVVKQDATTVRRAIPEQQTIHTYDNSEASPYVTGKPMIKLLPPIKYPDLYLMMEDDQWEPEFKLPGLKNGKLPRYDDGLIPYEKDGVKYNINPNVVGSELINVTTPDIVVTGRDLTKPLSYRSSYNPNLIREFTDWAPVVGDIGQGLDAYNAFKNLDYLLAGILGGAFLLPNALEMSGRLMLRFGLTHAPNLTKNLYDIKNLYNPKDNPRLRKYANEVRDLILSLELKYRRGGYDPSGAIAIDNTLASFLHGDKLWTFPSVQLGEYNIQIPIPSRHKSNIRGYNSWYPEDRISIKRIGQSPDEIRNTVYHEMSHASDGGKGVDADIYNKLQPKVRPEYFGKETEKRARIIETLTNMKHCGYDIGDPLSIFQALLDPSIVKTVDFLLLLDNYNTSNLYEVLLKGYKDGKSPINIKHPGRLTRLKKRTGKSESELYNDGNPAHKKMVVFARNARKWKH